MNLSSCRGIVRCGLTFLAALIFALSGQAQQTLGSINGTVVDPSGAAVPAATITVTNSATNLTETTTTQRTGFFQIFNLPIGSYIVKIAHEGFDTSELTGIAVPEARTATINASLKIGKASESVEVTANPMLNASDATNGYTLDAAQIDATPLATGSFTQLATLSPGVNAELLSGLNSNAGLGNQPIWANGQRDTSNTFQVNGVDATNLFNGKSSSGMTSQRYNFNMGRQHIERLFGRRWRNLGSTSTRCSLTPASHPTGWRRISNDSNSMPKRSKPSSSATGTSITPAVSLGSPGCCGAACRSRYIR